MRRGILVEMGKIGSGTKIDSSESRSKAQRLVLAGNYYPCNAVQAEPLAVMCRSLHRAYSRRSSQGNTSIIKPPNPLSF